MNNKIALVALALLSPPKYLEMKKDHHQLVISSEKTKAYKEVADHKMVPRGSAVLTPSGHLEKSGIKRIIHAATGSMTKSGPNFDPTLEGLKLSLKNSLVIAQKQGLKCIAVPFIGGGIFLHAFKMTKTQLAEAILESTIAEKSKPEIIFVTWGAEDTAIFQTLLKKHAHPHIRTVEGSITDFKIHKCETIVNAANMEIVFGGGISGVIGNATGQGPEINKMAQELIHKFYQ
jgi:O-acetyl-ADP-ribose deacetylase (regulator of RNase III)